MEIFLFLRRSQLDLSRRSDSGRLGHFLIDNVAEVFFETKRLETHLEVDHIGRGGCLVVFCLDSHDAARQSDRS